MVTHSKKGGNQ